MESRIVKSDCLSWLNTLTDRSVDLVFGSPPYEKARLYLEGGQDLQIARTTDEWVQWMVQVVIESLRVSRGLVAYVVEGQTKRFRYSAGPVLLMADLVRRGVTIRKPPIFHRIGIPGSGGPDWLRNDYEFIVCCTNGGRLPWSDNTACGHAPKWAPGGDMSHRLTDGTKVNQWWRVGTKTRGGERRPDGTRQRRITPSHQVTTNGAVKRGAASGQQDGDTRQDGVYVPPAVANPGNLPERLYTVDEVKTLLHHLGDDGDVMTHRVGGNLMGSKLAHENEAPFPERLADFFVRSFCPPGGVVADPFSGSGTTIAAAIKAGRIGIGCDLRDSQVTLTTRRIEEATRSLMIQEL